MPARPLNATAASLLGFLHAGPLTGWDLVATAELVVGDFWSLTRSQVYRELAAMDTAGLVMAGEVGPRERRPYHLTDAGREAFVAWLDREPGPEQIRYPLLLTMAFGQHLSPGRLAGEGLDAYAGATLDFGVRYERAVLDWFDHLPDEVGGGAAGGPA
jgi:DNA-binding PadR family transcriptional regulator